MHAGPVHTCAYLTALAGFKPLVTMSWASDILYEIKHDSWLAKAARYALKRTSVLVGDCQAVADKAREYKFPEDRIILFPWGVDLELFSPTGSAKLRKELGWEDKFVTLCLRSWEPVYGVDVTLQAFTQAAGEVPDLRLLLFGNGSQEKQIHELIAQHGLKDRVYLGGKIRNADLSDVYRSADIYLTAAHSDGSSVSLMEAMACGLPAVASDIPGNLEWMQPGNHGWIFPDGDIQKMTGSILDAFSKREELGGMSKTVRQYAEVHADWNKNFPKLLYAYDLAVGDHS